MCMCALQGRLNDVRTHEMYQGVSGVCMCRVSLIRLVCALRDKECHKVWLPRGGHGGAFAGEL